jgi:outer membrane protein assembly factor BamA
MIRQQPGEPASAAKLKEDIDGIRKLYGTVGRMTATVTPEPDFDDAAGTVTYLLRVHEGEIFHVGDVDIQGVDQKVADKLRDAWELRETDTYDSSYVQRFIEQSWKLLPTGLNWTVSVHEAVNEKDQTVDVSLRYGLKQ